MRLAAYIQHDLRRRIRSGEALLQKLTLPGLAHSYGVSPTPVRVAVGQWIREGYVRKLANGRLAIHRRRGGAGGPGEAIQTPRTTGDWDRILVREVWLASLGRDAVYLREEALAKKHGVGRSVIRHAFSRLVGAGLLESVPRHGRLVHPHQYLFDKSGNRYIRDFFRQYVALYYTMLFDYAAPEAKVVSDMARQHRQILRALIRSDWRRARKALANHIRSQGAVLSRLPSLARHPADLEDASCPK
jgi:DNA-binding GntR family transcriptional regulator